MADHDLDGTGIRVVTFRTETKDLLLFAGAFGTAVVLISFFLYFAGSPF
jgi:hypothetical protein